MTPTDIDPFDELGLVDRYLAGQATDAEAAYIAAWAKDVPERVQLLNSMQAALAEITHGVPRRETQAVLQQMLAKARRRGGRRSFAAWRKGRVWGSRTLRRGAWSVGVSALFALIAVFVIHRPTRDVGMTRTYATAVGQRATLLLDDGSHVTMAPQTTVKLVRFSRSSRTIILDGDAYFEVVPSTRAPFVVQAGATTTQVLGTAFEVKHYNNEREVRVAVASGKVLVSGTALHSAVPVTAGRILSITDSTQMVKAVDNIDTEIGWLGDRLLFQDAPMAKVLATLTRWYGYEFRYTDSALVQQNVTIGLSMRSSTEALATLEQILDVSLTVVGDTVTLMPMHGRTAPRQRAKHYDVWVPTREVGR